jgi:hypothetical protein
LGQTEHNATDVKNQKRNWNDHRWGVEDFALSASIQSNISWQVVESEKVDHLFRPKDILKFNVRRLRILIVELLQESLNVSIKFHQIFHF